LGLVEGNTTALPSTPFIGPTLVSSARHQVGVTNEDRFGNTV